MGRMERGARWWAAAGLALVLGPAATAAEQSPARYRVALVIGNAEYRETSARLVNPVKDARAVRDVLEELGFLVTFEEDADKVKMERAAQSFVSAIRPGAVAVFYYAGHGMELDGRNYLAPVEASTRWDSILTRNKSFLANEVQERMEEKGAAQRILILDACRDNPFDGRSLGRGGGGAMAPRGGLVAYVAGAGQVAADDGRYAARLVEALRVPGLSLDAVFTRVGRQIESSSGGRQTPARYSSGAVGGFVLNGSDPSATGGTGPTRPTRPDRTPSRRWAGEVFRDCPSCPEMVVIPAGTFRMGSPASEEGRSDDEGPQHRVTLRSFALGRLEVTRSEYAAFVTATGYGPGDGCAEWTGRLARWTVHAERSWRAPGFAQGGGHPVVCVSWGDAQAYAEWLSAETGESYRLPSESEWEYAARAGTTTARYWGAGSDGQCGYANGADAALMKSPFFKPGRASEKVGCNDGAIGTASVGSYGANDFRLFDVLGNVAEWVEDCWHDDYRGAPSDGRAWTVGGNCGRRAWRGGSWHGGFGGPGRLRSASRSWQGAANRVVHIGFRVARTLD